MWETHKCEYRKDEWSDSRFDAYTKVVNTGNKTLDYVLSTVNDNHREKERNLRFNRFNIMGRLKHVKISKFENINGEFNDSERSFNHRNLSLKKLISEAKEQKRTTHNLNHDEVGLFSKTEKQKQKTIHNLDNDDSDSSSPIKPESLISETKEQKQRTTHNLDHDEFGLPLPINKFSRIVGVIRDDMRDKIPRHIKNKRSYDMDPIVYQYMNLNRSELLTDFIEDDIKIFGGDWKYARQNIVNMCTDSKRKTYDYNELVDGYFSRADIDLVLPYLGKYNSDSILGLPINPQAKSGHLTSRLVSRKRKISTTFTKEAAKYYADEVMKRDEFTFDKSLTSIGGREKRVKLNSINKKFKTRGINNPEDIPTLISQSVIKPINENLQKRNEGFNYGGRINGGRNYLKFLDIMKCETDEININPDVTQHDGSVQEVHAVVAISLLLCCYDESEELNKLFIYILSSVIYRRFVLPESGLIYEVTKGLSTGHGFTSIMTTLIAYGTLATAINKTCTPKEIKRSRIINAGDDITARIKTNKLDDIYNEIKDNSGFDFDDIRDYSGYFSASNRNGLNCTFLKKKYNNFSWNDKELFMNLLTPTMKSSSFGSRFDNLKQMILQAPFDNNLNNELKIMMAMYAFENYYNRRSNKSKILQPSNRHYDQFVDYLARTPNNKSNPINYLNSINGKDNYFEIWSHPHQQYVSFDIVKYLIYEFEKLDKAIFKKRRWFNKFMNFESHRVTMRLAVFDVGKLATNPQGYYYKRTCDYRVMRI